MSTIVAVKKGKKVTIASDTLTTFGRLKLSSDYEANQSKIIKYKGSYISFSGFAAHDLALREILESKKTNFNNKNNIFKSFLKIHSILKKEYFLIPTDDEDDAYESSRFDALIANKYGIFYFGELREVHEIEKFWAIGSGADFAIGAMYPVYDELTKSDKIAEIGINAGCEFDKNSNLPYDCFSLNLLDKKRK